MVPGGLRPILPGANAMGSPLHTSNLSLDQCLYLHCKSNNSAKLGIPVIHKKKSRNPWNILLSGVLNNAQWCQSYDPSTICQSLGASSRASRRLSRPSAEQAFRQASSSFSSAAVIRPWQPFPYLEIPRKPGWMMGLLILGTHRRGLWWWVDGILVESKCARKPNRQEVWAIPIHEKCNAT